jgi:hypothetical protein
MDIILYVLAGFAGLMFILAAIPQLDDRLTNLGGLALSLAFVLLVLAR